MKLKNKKLKKDFENIIKIAFKNLVPKSKSSSGEQGLYKSEDDLDYYNEDFYTGVVWLNQDILDNIRKHEEKINLSTSAELLKYICKSIYIKIKSRVETINNSLYIFKEQ
mgnify:CR=1 FL=1